MTDETRAELRRGIERLVRTTMRPSGDFGELEVDVWGPVVDAGEWRETVQVTSYFDRDDPAEPPPLSTAQVLALSVLVGDEATLPQSLADYLLDLGHEYATAIYEKGKRDGNPFLKVSKLWTAGMTEVARRLSSLTPEEMAQLVTEAHGTASSRPITPPQGGSGTAPPRRLPVVGPPMPPATDSPG